MPALGLKLRLNRISARILQVITTGLVMWQKMNLTPWSGSSRLIDASGNANNATAFTGRGLSFDGVNDVVTIGNTGNTVRSVVFLAYPDTTTQSFMQLTASGGVDVKITSGTLSGAGWTSPTYYVNGVASTTVAATTWQQIAVTSATAITASDVRLGLDNTTYYSGDLCNVKFFSVQLSAAQIAELYANPELAFPTGTTTADLVDWWPLAEGAAAGIALDGATVQNNGTLSGPTDVLSLPNPCPQWAFKGNSWPMFFDASNDTITRNTGFTPPANFTFSTWAMANSASGNNALAFITTTSAVGRALFIMDTGVNLRLRLSDESDETVNSTSNVIQVRKIHHLAATINTSTKTVRFYVDGVFINQAIFSTAFPWGTVLQSYTVGGGSGYFFNGIIFNHALFSNILTDAEITAIYNGGMNFDLKQNSGNYTSAANVVLWYQNTGNQDSDWIDLSGNGNNGTVNGSPGRVFLPEGTAAGMDVVGMGLAHPVNGEMYGMVNSYLLVNDSASLDISTNITIEAWVKPEILPTNSQWILSKDNVNTGRSYGLQYLGTLTGNGGKFNFYFFSSTTYKASNSTSVLPLNSWSHLCATYDGSNVRLYLNGALNNTVAQTGAIDLTNVAINIGTLGRITDIGDYFIGYIDDVRIYNVALTAAQVANNYTAGKGAHSY